MLSRLILRLVVALLFLSQSLTPFLHAHAGDRGPGSGALLHLHFSPAGPAAVSGQLAFAPDDGPVVLVPPELRREGVLSIDEQPAAIVVALPRIDGESRAHEPSLQLRALFPSDPLLHCARARAPPCLV